MAKSGSQKKKNSVISGLTQAQEKEQQRAIRKEKKEAEVKKF